MFSYIVMVRKLVKVQTIAGTSPDMLLTHIFLNEYFLVVIKTVRFLILYFYLAPFVYYNIEKTSSIQRYSNPATSRLSALPIDHGYSLSIYFFNSYSYSFSSNRFSEWIGEDEAKSCTWQVADKQEKKKYRGCWLAWVLTPSYFLARCPKYFWLERA